MDHGSVRIVIYKPALCITHLESFKHDRFITEFLFKTATHTKNLQMEFITLKSSCEVIWRMIRNDLIEWIWQMKLI